MEIHQHYEDDLIKITECLGQNRLLITFKQEPTLWNKWKAHRKARQLFPGFKKDLTNYSDVPAWFEMIAKKPHL